MDEPRSIRSKILTRDQLLARRAQARADGLAVVQCHGCFDIVHPGHIRHLQHAAQQGDLLLVTITADAVLNKGDGRPLFPGHLRAENLAAISCVDWVYVNPDPTAETLLDHVQPDVYVKGREYEFNDDPRFAAERQAVERHGGRIVFSSGDVVFSSTALVQAMEHAEDATHAQLHRLQGAHDLTPATLTSVLHKAQGARVLVIGEVLVDTYIHCDRPNVASESPVLSLRPLEQVSFDGGSAIVAAHLAALGAKPILITALPRRPEAHALQRRLQALGVEVRAVEVDGALLEKQRFLVGPQKVMKLDHVRTLTLDAAARARLRDEAIHAAHGCSAAIAVDFGLGLFTARSMSEFAAAVRPHVQLLTGDVSGRRAGLRSMEHFDALFPSEMELREATGDFDDSLNAVVWALMHETHAQRVVVTMGDEGLIAFERTPEGSASDAWASRVAGEHIPPLVRHAVDPLGCGDALLAVATLAMTTGATFAQSVYLGACAAATHAMRPGNPPLNPAELQRTIDRLGGSRLAVHTTGIAPRAVV
ncbi:MAG: adenylyltransferase/cytidyltransferase family protein [Phycisphaerales bacterium]|nr:adenylyltransferase/cytidyltransferase family protein [Phycisphaerales bacterium]